MEIGSGFVLRLATEEDIPALHRLIEASVRGLQAGAYTQERIAVPLSNGEALPVVKMVKGAG